MVAVFVARFPAVLDPVEVPLVEDEEASVYDEGRLTPEELVIAAEDELGSGVAAAEIVGMLSPEERRIVCLLDDPPAIQSVLGCGRSQAYHRARRLQEKLGQLIGDDDVQSVGREVIRLCCGTATST